MAIYLFELRGVTDLNLEAVKAKLTSIPGCACTLIKTASGTYLVHVESELSEDDVFELLTAAMISLGVTVYKTIPLKPVIVSSQHKP